MPAKENNRDDLKTWNGQTGAAETLSPNWNVSWSAGAVWKYTDNISENILKGYLDDNDNNQARVTFTNLPFTSGYDVYIYKAADGDGISKFSTVSVTIGEQQTYTYTTDETGVAYFGDAQWGQSQQATSALGTNVICIKGLTAPSITIKGGKRNAGRGAIAAIQVVETRVSNVINVTEDVFDARYLTAPVYLSKEGDLTIKVASEASAAKYVDVRGVTGTVTYEVDQDLAIKEQIAEKKAILKATLDVIEAHVGTLPGQVQTNAAFTAARALLDKANATLDEMNAETAHEANYYYTLNMPQAGVDYVLRNVSYSNSYLTSNGSNAVGQATPGIVNFEPVEDTTDQFYIKVNGLYVGVCYKSQQVTLSDSKANARRYSFGINNWNVVMQDTEQTAETTHAYLNLNVNGTILGWEKGDNATMWTVERLDFLADFQSLGFTAEDKFDLLDGATVKYPNEFGLSQYNLTPEGINTAIDALIAVEDTQEAKKAFMTTANGQTLKRYRSLLTENPGWGTPIAVSFKMKAEYGTLILPFPVVRPDDLEVFTCAGVETNGTTLTLTPMTNNLAHNTPYIIKGAVGAKYSLVGFDKGSRMTHTAGCLTGVLNEGGTNVPGGSYVLSKYQDVLAFYMVENGVSKNCPQFKCYFTAPAGSDNAKAFFFNPGDVTGIDAIVTDGGKAEIYNVYGQRLNGLRKGLNIVNGRKVVVK
ncbi:MAG: hypothetical protein MR693_05505 [Bacteroidales bacterium]|nr:hypothetical protein [Bacteroidales bacterium]